MPRWPRVFVEGAIYDVHHRFARGAVFFADPEEAIEFIEKSCKTIGTSVLAISAPAYEERSAGSAI